MRGILVVVVVAAACGKGASKSEVEACERMATLCGDSFSPADRKECVENWPTFRKELGDDTANKYLACTRDAKSCGEVLGCAVGVLGKVGKDFEKGLDKMMDEDLKGAHKKLDQDLSDIEKQMDQDLDKMKKQMDQDLDKMKEQMDQLDGPLPPQCKRADDVCAADEPFARDQCRDMVANLKADAENLTELTTCYAAAKNCFAFKKCTDDMWFKLN